MLSSRTPVLIITCKQGNETWCEEEIGNVLFRRDPQVIIAKSSYPDTLLVYSEVLSPEKAYRAVVFREYGFVENVIPVFCKGSLQGSFEDFIKCIEGVLGNLREVKLRVRLRGVRGQSELLWRRIRDFLEKKNIRHSPESKNCLFVEGFESALYGGVGFCQPIFKHLHE